MVCLQILNMSYIIDQMACEGPPLQPSPYSPTTSPSNQDASQASSPQVQKLEIINWLGRFSSSVVSSEVRRGHLDFSLLLNNVFRNISIILKIKLTSTNSLLLRMRLLAHDHKPLRVSNHQRRLLLCKYLIRYYLSHPSLNELKIALSMLNGELELLSPLYLHSQTSFEAIIAHTVKVLKRNLEVLQGAINFAKEVALEGPVLEKPSERVGKLLFYSQFTSVVVNFSQDSASDETTINRKQQKEIESIQKLKNDYVSMRNRNGLELFALSDFAAMRSEVLNFDILPTQRELFVEKVAPPMMPKPKNNENNFILNFVHLQKQPEEKQLKKLHISNFATIFYTEIEHWYVGSYNLQQAVMSPNSPPLKKWIVIKREEKGQKKGRIAHEKAILTKIKDGTALYLPKYYVNIERGGDDSELMCDYFGPPSSLTLAEFVAKKKDTMSYQTKIYLGYQIAQALRYLQEYQIVHLDLKPSNIIVTKGNVKLIDFGESYHPDIRNHQPGFSVPYSAPENYNHPQRYTHKNDVFSLGVILHELLLSKLPFNFQDPRRRDEVYRRGCISNFWLTSPEGNLSFGDGTIFPILQLLIGKCLSPNPDERPELEWIVLILRECFDIIY